MKERLKTFLLLSLVCISILFTKRLWIRLPGDMSLFLNRNNEVLSVSYLLSDMIVPNKYLINFNEENHTLVYDDSKYGTWINSRKNLSEILSSKNIKIEDISNEDYLKYHSEKSIVFYFPEKVNTYMLARAWDVKEPNSIADTMPNINSIYIYLGSGNPFFVFSENSKHIAIYDSEINISNLRDNINAIDEKKNYTRYYSMKQDFGIGNDIYVPAEIKNVLPRVYVTNEIATMGEEEKGKLVEKIFNKQLDYIEEVVEDNGSSIYIYNQRVIKFNINGTLEYFHPLGKVVKEGNLYASLSSAADFISKNTDAQKGMYLAKVEEINSDDSLGYRLTFRYRIMGIPVILGNREVSDYIQMEVFNDHIRSYKEYARKEVSLIPNTVIDGKEILPSYKVIDENYELLENRYLTLNNLTEDNAGDDIIQKVISSIKDVTLGYYDPCFKDKEEKLVGVWIIRLEGKLIAFDAYNGSLVFESK